LEGGFERVGTGEIGGDDPEGTEMINETLVSADFGGLDEGKDEGTDVRLGQGASKHHRWDWEIERIQRRRA
jgi:hypothetical protein